MRRTPFVVLVVGTLLLLAHLAVPAAAGDEDPTMEELARMVLHGTDAEQALVARWLEKADRDTLRRLFQALRALRSVRKEPVAREVTEIPPQLEGQALANVEVRILEVPTTAAAVLLDKAPKSTRGGGTSLAYLTDADVAALLRGVEKTDGAEVVGAPHLTVYDGQEANVNVLKEISYIQDFDVEQGNNGQTVGDPIIGVLQEGVVLELRPTISADRRTVTLEIKGNWAYVKRPIPDFKVKVGDQEVTIQLPEMMVSRARSTVRVPSGGSVLLRPATPESATVESVVLLRVEVLDLASEEERLMKGGGPPPPGK